MEKPPVKKSESAPAVSEKELAQIRSLQARVRGRNLEQGAGCLSAFFLGYLAPLLALGAKTPLTEPDLGVIHDQDAATVAYAHFKAAWEAELARPRASGAPLKMMSVVLGTLDRSRVAMALALYLGKAVLDFGPVLVLNKLVRHLQSKAQDSTAAAAAAAAAVAVPTSTTMGTAEVWVCIALLLVLPILSACFYARSQVIMSRLSVKLRTAVSVAMHRKALTLSSDARAKTSTGEIVNMMSNDASQLMRFVQMGFTMVFVAPLQIVACLVLIWGQVGVATLPGLALMLVMGPLTGKLFARIGGLRRQVLGFSDTRVKLMNEILAGIRIIKYASWEGPFAAKIRAVRQLELAALKKLCYLIAFGFSFILLSVPIVLPVLVFATYSHDGSVLDAATAFTTLSLFSLLRFPFAFLPMGILQVVQANIALGRIGAYLQLGETEDYVSELPAAGGDAIVLRDAAMCWTLPAATAAAGAPPSASAVDLAQPPQKQPAVAAGALEATLARADGDAPAATAAELAPLLDALTFSVKTGELVAIVGPVGAGKSSLIAAIAGEMLKLRGDVARRGKVALCAQEPWIMNATLQQNIMFATPSAALPNAVGTGTEGAGAGGGSGGADGEEVGELRAKYERALDLACLRADIESLPRGDQTLIGDRGINLSGGQKARCSFARAIFSDADVLLLDDPLSAVDAHVGKAMFGAMKEGLAGRTRVLVTHQTQYLPQCDRVIVLKNRTVANIGTYEELRAQGLDFQLLVEQQDEVAVAEKNAMKAAEDAKKAAAAKAAGAGGGRGGRNGRGGRGKGSKGGKGGKGGEGGKGGKGGKGGGGGGRGGRGGGGGGGGGGISDADSAEERSTGDVAWKTYKYYLEAGGWGFASLVVACAVTGRAGEIGSSFWLSYWSDLQLSGSATESISYYMGLYAALSMVGVVMITGRAVALALLRVRAAAALHDNLARAVLAAPTSFFDRTPIGRVLNRFAADCDKVDLELGASIQQVLNCFVNVLGALIGIVGATRGGFAVLLSPVLVAYRTIQRFFTHSNTEVQRIESISRSPIFASFSQTLHGIPTIRAFGFAGAVTAENERALDRNNRAQVLQQMLNTWLTLRLDTVGGFISCSVAAFAELSGAYISAGDLAIGLLFANEMSRFLQHGVKMWAATEAQMNAVERIQYYAEELDAEAPAELAADPPVGAWPTQGAITLRGVRMAYYKGPDVLRGLSFEVAAREKVGIVGRTGGGKTSLIAALFRIVELKEGRIEFDGVDIATLGLHTLRSRLSVIPQDPVVFNDTVRYNLDPFQSYSDAELWACLEKVQLKERLQDRAGKAQQSEAEKSAAAVKGGAAAAGPATALDLKISEGGSNLSVGERQLLCIGRALLRCPKIIVLDEATASVDNDTDDLIQVMIRENFKGSTVLTIAHRLKTVMDSDRILVMEQGQVAEFDAPKTLLAHQSGLLRGMVDATGEASARNLEALAGFYN